MAHIVRSFSILRDNCGLWGGGVVCTLEGTRGGPRMGWVGMLCHALGQEGRVGCAGAER